MSNNLFSLFINDHLIIIINPNTENFSETSDIEYDLNKLIVRDDPKG